MDIQSASQKLTERQKAAIIVGVVLGEGDEIDLSRLPASAQAGLAQEMSLMGLIDRDTRNAVITEFCDRLDAIGLSFPGDIDGTLDLLESHLSADTSDNLRRLAALNGAGDPWDRIAMLAPRILAELARTEALEIAAVMFSKLPVPRAAEVFAMLDPERSRQIAYAISLTGMVEAPSLRKIGQALIHAADAIPRPALEGKPAEKVGAILNSSTAATRDNVLDGLDAQDSDFAGKVRRTIFAWPNIPERIDLRDVPRIVREIDATVLAKAMAGAEGKDAPTVEFLFSALPTRLADTIRDEIEGLGKVLATDSEEARDQLIATIRRMESDGELFLVAAQIEDSTPN
ncbi:FliG C-terminal domain-containing protein [Paracoccus ravus]|uniref:FliG C-terminal domain-containing protein n=1 Tax=Paracoccus ravus TaxID=2447760 RepID=UPI00106E3F4F|nr:FliG C-terminal domain-containing protein [Paracoccus ravus]